MTDSERRTSRRPHIVARIRGTANVVLLMGALLTLVAVATHWPPETIAPVGLLTMAAFFTSFFAILVENRLPEPDDGQDRAAEGPDHRTRAPSTTTPDRPEDTR